MRQHNARQKKTKTVRRVAKSLGMQYQELRAERAKLPTPEDISGIPTLLDEHQNKWHLSGPIMNRLCYMPPSETDFSVFVRNTLRALVRAYPMPQGTALPELATRLHCLATEINCAVERGFSR